MTRFVHTPLPISPESDYDRRLQQYLDAVLGVNLVRTIEELARVTDVIAIELGPTGEAQSATLTLGGATTAVFSGENQTLAGPNANLYVSGNPAVSGTAHGLRVHYATAASLAVIDCNYPIIFRTGAGAGIASIRPNGTIRLEPQAADPAGTAHGDIWALASGVFRRNRNGTIETW